MRQLVPFVFVLICPLMMLFMMRGMHGSRSRADRLKSETSQHGASPASDDAEVAALREERDDLRARIEQLEGQVSRLERSQAGARVPTPV